MRILIERKSMRCNSCGKEFEKYKYIDVLDYGNEIVTIKVCPYCESDNYNININ